MAEGGRIRILLLPLDGLPALVPTALVAEVTPYAMPEAAREAPPWLLGFVPWRGRRLPLVSLEQALGRPEAGARVGRQKGMVVFYGMLEATSVPYYAAVTAGPPHPRSATADQLRDHSRLGGPYGWARVDLGETGAAEILDLERLERDLAAVV